MDIIEYRKVSQKFRRVASNMLTTKRDDGNIQLIRFRKFIEENELINNIIKDKIRDVEYDYKGNFIIEDIGWLSISIPIDDSEHVKAMYDYLIDITKEEGDIRWVAQKFSHGKKWDDMIRSYLDKAFKPLVDFIVDSLSMEMIGMDNTKQETHIHQNINTNYGTASIAQGDINSTNIVNLNDMNEVKDLIESLKVLIKEQEIDEEIKDEFMDDLECIEEEVSSDKPKHIRIRKACKGIKNFMTKIPQGIAKATVIVTQCTELYEKLKPFIEK